MPPPPSPSSRSSRYGPICSTQRSGTKSTASSNESSMAVRRSSATESPAHARYSGDAPRPASPLRPPTNLRRKEAASLLLCVSRLSVRPQRAIGQSLQLIGLSTLSVEANHSLARSRLGACVGVPVGTESARAVDEILFSLAGSALTIKGFAQAAGGSRRAPCRLVGASGPVHRGRENSFCLLQPFGAQQHLAQKVLRGRPVWMVGRHGLLQVGDRRTQLRFGLSVLLAIDLYDSQRGAVDRRSPVMQTLRSDRG